MCYKTLVLPLAIFWVPAENVDLAVGCTGSKNQAVLPGSPRDTIHWATKLLLQHFVIFPVLVLVLPPNDDFVVVPARSNHRFELGMRPCNLPNGTLVCRKCLGVLLLSIRLNLADLDEAVAIAWCQLSAIVIELTIIDVVLVGRLKWVNFLRISRNWLLSSFRVSCH